MKRKQRDSGGSGLRIVVDSGTAEGGWLSDGVDPSARPHPNRYYIDDAEVSRPVAFAYATELFKDPGSEAGPASEPVAESDDALDFEAILRKYMTLVINEESESYVRPHSRPKVGERGFYLQPEMFTDAEWDALQRLASQLEPGKQRLPRLEWNSFPACRTPGDRPGRLSS